jgi:hypothetical protein
MTKPTLLIVLASLLSGCVTSNDHYSQTAARSAVTSHSEPATVRSSKMQDKVASPVMLGAAY